MEELKYLTDPTVINYVKSMAHGMGVGIEYAWNILIRQERMYGITLMLPTFALSVFSFVCWRMFAKKASPDLKILAVLCYAALQVAAGVSFMDGIMHVANPEFYAVKDIIETVRGVSNK